MARSLPERKAAMRRRLVLETAAQLRAPTVRAGLEGVHPRLAALFVLREARLAACDGLTVGQCDETLRRMVQPRHVEPAGILIRRKIR